MLPAPRPFAPPWTIEELDACFVALMPLPSPSLAALIGPMSLNPLKWKYEDQVGLITATAFGATFGLASGYSPGQGLFNVLWALIGAVVVGGAFYCYRAFR